MGAGRTLLGMEDRDARIVEEFVAGAEVQDIAARYAVPEAYVDRVIEQTSLTKPKRHDWSLNNWGNRLAYCLLAGMVVNLTTHLYALGIVVVVVLFVLTTAIAATRRR